MPFRLPSFRINEIVAAPKKSRQAKPRFEKCGESGLKVEAPVELIGGSFVDIKVKISAGVLDDPSTFSAALILDGERVRGVDYCPIERRRHFRTRIPKGWHQNFIDPNLPSSDPNQNRHEEIAHCEISDFHCFLKFIGKLWDIDFGLEETLL